MGGGEGVARGHKFRIFYLGRFAVRTVFWGRGAGGGDEGMQALLRVPWS